MGRKRTRKEGEWTTVSIKKETKDIIDKSGKYGDNFDDVLRKVLRMVKKG